MPLMDDLHSLLQVIQSPAYFFDVNSFEILAVNTRFAAMMDYPVDELLKMSVKELRPPEDVGKLMKALSQSPPEGSVEWRYLTRTGRMLYVQLTYRNSLYLDKIAGRKRDVRLVVVSRFETEPMKKADELFGA